MVSQIALWVRGEIPPSPLHWGGDMMNNFAREGFFYQLWKSEKWFRLSKLFAMLKTTFCKYLTSVKIKASKTYAYNKREAKKEIVYAEAMNTTKSDIFIKLQHENCYSVVGNAALLGAE